MDYPRTFLSVGGEVGALLLFKEAYSEQGREGCISAKAFCHSEGLAIA